MPTVCFNFASLTLILTTTKKQEKIKALTSGESSVITVLLKAQTIQRTEQTQVESRCSAALAEVVESCPPPSPQATQRDGDRLRQKVKRATTAAGWCLYLITAHLSYTAPVRNIPAVSTSAYCSECCLDMTDASAH